MAFVQGTVSSNDPGPGDVTVTPPPPGDPVLFLGLETGQPDEFTHLDDLDGMEAIVEYTEILPYHVDNVTPV